MSGEQNKKNEHKYLYVHRRGRTKIFELFSDFAIINIIFSMDAKWIGKMVVIFGSLLSKKHLNCE